MTSHLRSVATTIQSRQILRTYSTAMVKVQVKQGCVVGKENLTANGNIFHSYQGIPYAKPPVGKLRFKSPEPLERFNVPELDCTQERNVSHQRDPFTQSIVGSEDCLFLNIYTPKTFDGPWPVIVYIHGGGFWFGSGNSDYFYPKYLMDENVVVVTMNYRLGALGFLSLPEEGIWGNAGLKDQRLCLEWINENIQHFNGDPQNVTLVGESAGAASVHLHSYAAHANKLFHKAIMQSGTANMEWVFQANPDIKTRRIAQLLGCESSNSKEILDFLQSKHVKPLNLLAKTLDVLTPDERRRGLPLAFKPIIENTASPDKFIDRPILELLQQPNTLKLPTIMGYNSGEGMAMTINAIKKLKQVDTDLERFVPRNIPLSPHSHQNELRQLASEMRKFYFNDARIDDNQLESLTDLLSDYHFTVDMQNAAEWQVRLQKDAPLYFYRFDYVGGRNMYKYLFQFQHLRGACHGDELFYLFQNAGNDTKYGAADELCVQRLCRLWSNFARYSKPTDGIKHKAIDFNWQAVQKPKNENEPFTLNYLDFGKTCEMRNDPDKARIEFWRNVYKEFEPTDYSLLSAKL